MGIEDVAFELYGLAREDFTAARNVRAKEAKDCGDRELAAAVQALRKPTAGAWLLNQLMRQHRGEVEQVLELGTRLRAAQGTSGAVELRALDGQRRRLTRSVALQAVAIGQGVGQKVSAQVSAEVEGTLRSAMVDPGAGAALATGLITDTFSSTGLEPVDLSRVVALTGVAAGRSGSGTTRGASGGNARSTARDERAITVAQQAVAQAEETLGAARETSQEVRRRAVEVRRRREDLESELGEARRHLEELNERVAAATEAEDAARRAQISATHGERAAVESAGRARQRLNALLDDTRT